MKDNLSIFESAQDMMICELDRIVQKKEVTPSTLDYLDKIVDIIKDLDEVSMNEEDRIGYEDGHSSRGSRYYNRSSYRSGMYDGYPVRRGSSYGNDNYMGNSRGDTNKESMLNHLYAAYDTASNEEERKRIKRMIDEIESK